MRFYQLPFTNRSIKDQMVLKEIQDMMATSPLHLQPAKILSYQENQKAVC